MAAMSRSLSSCLEATRMWRSTERRKFGKEALDEVEPAVLRREDKFKAVFGPTGKPSSGLFGDVRGMIVEDQLDRGSDRIGGVEQLEEFDEFAAAVAILDQSVDLAGDEINPSQQTDRAVPLVFMLAGKGRMHAGLRRQIGGGRSDRLNAWLLVGVSRQPGAGHGLQNPRPGRRKAAQSPLLSGAPRPRLR